MVGWRQANTKTYGCAGRGSKELGFPTGSEGATHARVSASTARLRSSFSTEICILAPHCALSYSVDRLPGALSLATIPDVSILVYLILCVCWVALSRSCTQDGLGTYGVTLSASYSEPLPACDYFNYTECSQSFRRGGKGFARIYAARNLLRVRHAHAPRSPLRHSLGRVRRQPVLLAMCVANLLAAPPC